MFSDLSLPSYYIASYPACRLCCSVECLDSISIKFYVTQSWLRERRWCKGPLGSVFSSLIMCLPYVPINCMPHLPLLGQYLGHT